MTRHLLSELEFKKLFLQYAHQYKWEYTKQVNDMYKGSRYALRTKEKKGLCPIEAVALKHVKIGTEGWEYDARHLRLDNSLRDIIIDAADDIEEKSEMAWFFRHAIGYEPVAHIE